MASKTLDFMQFMQGDGLAHQIANTWLRWKGARSKRESEWEELRQFLFATDTRTTSTGQLGWANSTTLPKLTQVRDNLHANYMAALFPNENWLTWIGEDEASVTKETRLILENYMMNRLNASKFVTTVSTMVYDFIDFGNVIGGTNFITEKRKREDGQDELIYSGPKAFRISPYDIVFDPTATDFRHTPKITRVIKTMGSLVKDATTIANGEYNLDVLKKAQEKRAQLNTLSRQDVRKVEQLALDGLGSLQQYLSSGDVELLEFEGDIYDVQRNELQENRRITILDRAYIIRNVPNTSEKVHAGWRLRPDNLVSMVPLDNLVGLQYRIDHLENLRADIFDQIAHPTRKIKGIVPDIPSQPGIDINLGDEGDVTYLHPDTTALNADFQIRELERRMEEFAGSPKESMGFRTPGEKTAFEVQQLQNASSRIFQNKITYFEEIFLEPLINEMFRQAREHATDDPSIEKIFDPESSVIEFRKIVQKDLEATGRFRPMGARHFAAQAKLVQDLNNFIGSPIGQDEAVKVHFSGKAIARLMDEQLNFEKFNLFSENIRVAEQLETAKLQQIAQQRLQKDRITDPAPNDGTQQ